MHTRSTAVMVRVSQLGLFAQIINVCSSRLVGFGWISNPDTVVFYMVCLLDCLWGPAPARVGPSSNFI